MRVLVALLLVIGVADAVASPDWDVRRDPFDRQVVARYRQILARDPHDAILARLIDLYRRYRTLDELRKSYSGDDWATLVVLARIERGHDNARARELLERATAARSQDLQSWILLGELLRKTDLVAAGEAYRRAYVETTARTPRKQVIAVYTALAELAVLAGDAPSADLHLRALIGIDPSPARWIAHGDAMLATSPRDALASYLEAETRLRDPLARVDAMTRAAAAHGKLGEHPFAIAQLRRALAMAPRGSGLAADLVQRILEHARSANRVPEELRAFEVAWPDAARGAFEHLTLGQLQESAGFPHRAIFEYEAAIAAAPRDPAGYRAVVGVLDRQGRPADALARFEVMAKLFPRDAGIQLDLARRYGLAREAEAVAVLEALARALPRDAGVQATIADLYVAWRRPALAAAAYARAAKLDASYKSSLAMAYAAAGDRNALLELARAAGRDPARLGEIANLMLEHAMWDDARTTFDAALALEPSRAALWTGLAGAYEGLERWATATNAAYRALVLTTTTDERARKAMRHIVVRDALRTNDAEGYWKAWRTQLVTALDRTDLAALLAELDTSDQITNAMRLEHLERLHREFRTDARVMQDLVDVYVLTNAFDDALRTLDRLAALPGQDPHAIAERRKVILQRARQYAREVAWDVAAFRESVLVEVAPRKDAASQQLRIGLRATLGAGDDARMLRLGAIATLQLVGGLAVVGRLDWTEAALGETHQRGAGGSAGLVTRLGETPNALWSAGGALRVDVGSGAAPVAVAGEAGLDLTSRYTPFGVGLRLGRYLGGGTVANLELVVEWR